MNDSISKAARRSLAVTFSTGATALVYEVTWQRYLSNILGSEAKATAIVLAVFLGGLGLGYLLFGKLTAGKSQQALVRLCGLVEAAIGIWALLFMAIFPVASNVVLSFGSFFLELLTVAVLIGPGTVLMGGTLPLLTQGLAPDQESSSRIHTYVYASNTGGAFLGCLLAGFFLVPTLGLPLSLTVAVAINLIAGLYLYSLGKNLSAEPLPSTSSEAAPLSLLGIIALIVGACSIALQALLIRVIGLSMGSSEYAFGMLVATFILLISLGSWFIAGRHTPRLSLWQNQLLALVGLVVLYFSIPYWPYLIHVIRISMPTSPVGFYLYQLSVMLFVLLLIALPVGCLGSTMPILFYTDKKKHNDLGQSVGRLYALNTTGCIIGALVGGYLLLYWMNFDRIFLILTALVALTVLLTAPRRIVSQIAVVVVGLALLPTLSNWDPSYLGIGLFHEREAIRYSFAGPSKLYSDLLSDAKIVGYRDGPNMSVTVADFDDDSSSTIFVNGKADGNTIGDRVHTKTMAHLAGLLSPATDGKAAVMGFGTGMTLGSLALYDHIKQIDLVEISSMMKELAPHFDHANYNVSKSEKIRWHKQDIYKFLLHSEDAYDTIISQPSNPWLAGLDRLYTVEFYDLVKKRMSSHGIFVNWLSQWGLSKESLRIIISTFQSSFPEVKIFKFRDSVFLIGLLQPIDDHRLSTLVDRFYQDEVHADLTDVGFTSPEGFLALEQWYPINLKTNKALNSLYRPRLGHQAGQDFYLDKQADLEELLPDPKAWQKALVTSKNSLMAKLMQQTIGDIDLERISEASCGSASVKLVEPNWRYSRTPCRDSIIALMATGRGAVPENLKTEIQWLQYYLTDQIPDPRTAQEAMQEIALFMQFHSVFIPLSVEKLKERSSLCLEGTTPDHQGCQQQLANAITYVGYPGSTS